jgi:2-C-methyl-D-erythritol 4-phosphate cytidylyltransferase
MTGAPNANRYAIGVAPPAFWEGSRTGYPVEVLGIPVSDTCKEVVAGLVRRTVPRDSLVTISGPWLFAREGLIDGLGRIAGREQDITDLVGFCEAARLKVRVVLPE